MTRTTVRRGWVVTLMIAAALAATLAAIALSTTPQDQGKGGWVALTLFLYWRIWRGGPIARRIELCFAIFGACLFASASYSGGAVSWGWLQGLFYVVEGALLLAPPVRRFVAAVSKERSEPTPARVAAAH